MSLRFIKRVIKLFNDVIVFKVLKEVLFNSINKLFLKKEKK